MKKNEKVNLQLSGVKKITNRSTRYLFRCLVVFLLVISLGGAGYIYDQTVSLEDSIVKQWIYEKVLTVQSMKGDSDAQYKLAFHLSTYKPGSEQIRQWLVKSAEAKNINARLALLKKKPNQSFSSLLSQIQQQGYVESQYQLAKIYAAENEDLDKLSDSIDLYRAAARSDHRKAQYELALILSELPDAPSGEALQWLKEAASAPHNIRAQVLLARHYHNLNRFSRYKDSEFIYLTEKWLKIAAATGDSDAQYELGYLYQYFFFNYEHIDITDAYQLFELAAEQGHDKAAYELGRRYYYDGPEKDIRKAVYWYQRSAKKGHIESQYKLGEIYLFGNNTIKSDVNVAIKWIKSAAELEYLDAMYLMARCYYYGDGVNKDMNAAVKWLKEAIAINDARIDKINESPFLYIRGFSDKAKAFLDRIENKG